MKNNCDSKITVIHRNTRLKIEKKGEKWLLGFGHFFWAGVERGNVWMSSEWMNEWMSDRVSDPVSMWQCDSVTEWVGECVTYAITSISSIIIIIIIIIMIIIIISIIVAPISSPISSLVVTSQLQPWPIVTVGSSPAQRTNFVIELQATGRPPEPLREKNHN